MTTINPGALLALELIQEAKGRGDHVPGVVTALDAAQGHIEAILAALPELLAAQPANDRECCRKSREQYGESCHAQPASSAGGHEAVAAMAEHYARQAGVAGRSANEAAWLGQIASELRMIAAEAAPQAVDLGRFREAIAGAHEFIARHSYSWNGEGVHPNRVYEGLERLLAQIDSQQKESSDGN